MSRLKPSPEAQEWGKRQAARSPRWTDQKWERIATILGVAINPADPELKQDDEATEHRREAA
ncbi:hypothetical protein [Actinoallomurus rhizosphaericola]|uniref:hypothetical protein n=1 Tax=Actinoallomurus rhizosphaericola TaxID=2952536 RepID=UPI00209317C8|nr:hypothetical protein [Actinoallomurus rhizosphaericola]MCO5996044.1 hypothetical protein [Actinoallomurus rhizosphaericola]